MDMQADIIAVEQRAFRVRLTVKELCERAKVYPSVWSRAKSRGRVSVSTLKKMEAALVELEQAA
jgi:hypothetical protein